MIHCVNACPPVATCISHLSSFASSSIRSLSLSLPLLALIMISTSSSSSSGSNLLVCSFCSSGPAFPLSHFLLFRPFSLSLSPTPPLIIKPLIHVHTYKDTCANRLNRLKFSLCFDTQSRAGPMLVTFAHEQQKQIQNCICLIFPILYFHSSFPPALSLRLLL